MYVELRFNRQGRRGTGREEGQCVLAKNNAVAIGKAEGKEVVLFADCHGWRVSVSSPP